MSKLTLLTSPPGTDELFRQRLRPHTDDMDGVQPYDAREAKVLAEAVAWHLVPADDAASWYTLTEALPFAAAPSGVVPEFWVPFRTWAGWIKGHPVSALANLAEFNPSIYAPSGEPYPEGTVFTADGQAHVPAGVKPLGDLHIPASIADRVITSEAVDRLDEDEVMTLRKFVAFLQENAPS